MRLAYLFVFVYIVTFHTANGLRGPCRLTRVRESVQLTAPVRLPLELNLFGFLSAQQAPVDVSALKSKIVDASRGTSNGLKASELQRATIAESVRLLEKQNRVKKIASSPLLNGSWRLIYTTNEGSSAGKLGPLIGEVVQIVDQPQKSYINKVTLAKGVVDVSLSASWEEKKPAAVWQVTFLDLKFQLFGLQLGRTLFDGVTGIWRTTYLDESMRVLYAIGGKNTVKENIYILVKD